MNAVVSSFFLPCTIPLYCRMHGVQGVSAALIVPPLFGELIQTHRAFFTLCNRLEQVGIPAIVVDLTGTGDSGGDLADAGITQWERDIARAMEALLNRSGASEVILIGCRLSATIALGVAQREAMIARVVLWQPVAQGNTYMDELRALHLTNLTPYTAQTDHPDPAFTDLLGFSVPQQLVAEIEALSLDGLSLRPDQSALCLGAALQDAGALGRLGAKVTTQAFDTLRGWMSPSEGVYDVMVPTDALDRTLAWVTGHDA